MRIIMATNKVRGQLFGLLVLALLALRTRDVNGQASSYANEVILGGITAATNTLCWTESVNVRTFFRVPARALTFTSATAVTYIHCWNNLPLHPFTASIVAGGIGNAGANTIALSGVTGKLVATCEAYCVMIG
ncbi:uncharacterized protein LOC120430771 [Culex pipiens pallens]|uniref:uncharacterized protein LOC120430771 n=1 Tax=Culex pipiens pallens TaxID=42434 RepID=UPI0019542644|nr:uncharacterized protein LOC120430771 [Culex pipiens pallens]